jgi:glycerol-3-phosphate acyltransferase PlsX
LLRFKKRVDHRAYNGAMLLGLRGLVIKSHGSADRFAFYTALVRAYEASKNHMVENIQKAFENVEDLHFKRDREGEESSEPAITDIK